MSRAAALSPDAKTLAILHGAPPTLLTIVDLTDGAKRHEITIDAGGTGACLVWSPNGRVLGSVERGRTAFYSEALVELGHVDMEYPSSIAFSGDSTNIALGSWTKGILLDSSESNDVTRRRLTHR
jgi:hypothetical protein